MLREDLNTLKEYLEKCKEIGFDEVILLDLVMYPNRNDEKDIEFFKEQYVPYNELLSELKKINNIEFKRNKYGHSKGFITIWSRFGRSIKISGKNISIYASALYISQ